MVGREGDLHRALLAGARAEQALLEARNRPAGADLDELVAPLAAGHGSARRLARAGIGGVPRDVVDHDEVAFLGRPLRRLQAREAVAHGLHLLGDLLLADRRLAPGGLDPEVGAQFGLGQHPDLDRERKRPSLGRQL